LNGVLENRGLVLVGTAYGVLWEAGLFRGFWDRLANGSYGPGIVRDTIRTIAAGNIPSIGRIAMLFTGIVGLLLVVRLLSMVWSFLRLYEFRLSRVGEDLRTEYGLLTRVTTTIPLKRVQSLTVGASPLQRLLGRMSVRVETAGGHASPQDGQRRQPRERLAPIIRRAAVPALVREVLPGFDFDRLDWQALHPRAFRRAVKPALVVAAVTPVPFVYWFGWPGLAVLPITIPWLCALAWAHVRYTQWAATEDVLALRSGWLWREMTIVPATKVQVVGRIESWFDRRAGMAGVRVDTAGSPSPMHRISIPYLSRDTAVVLYVRLASQTAQTAFRW
jgi:putative membrane protein